MYARLDPVTNKVIKDKEEEEDDDILFVSPYRGGPRDPKFDDDGHDGGFGPMSAAGGLIEAAV
ncbi:hypothetical protein PG988_002565 [Apiospora saccharicola]